MFNFSIGVPAFLNGYVPDLVFMLLVWCIMFYSASNIIRQRYAQVSKILDGIAVIFCVFSGIFFTMYRFSS